jgi:hypothetical protein
MKQLGEAHRLDYERPYGAPNERLEGEWHLATLADAE